MAKKNFEFSKGILSVTNQGGKKFAVKIDEDMFRSVVKSCDKLSVKKNILYAYKRDERFRVDHAIISTTKRLYPHELPSVRFKNGNSLDLRNSNIQFYGIRKNFGTL